MLTAHPPRPWRELRRSNRGPDVEALQRCLWHLLHQDSTNARNGYFGQGTASDVAKARRKLKMTGTDIVGGLLWAALWEYADEYAVALAAKVPPGSTWAPGQKRAPLTIGHRGPDVEAAQRGLWRLLGDDRSNNARNGVFGIQTAHDVKLARTLLGLEDKAGGVLIGRTLWAALTRYFDATATTAAARAPDPPHPVPAVRAQIVTEARYGYDHRTRFRYAQARPMPHDFDSPAPILTDCSGYVTLANRGRGPKPIAPNPNRRDGIYDGYGWTGTLESVCHWVSSPLPGDLAEYNGHTAMVDEHNSGIYSFGHDPITHYDTWHYRSDFRGFLRSPHLTDSAHMATLVSTFASISRDRENPFELPPVPPDVTPQDPDDLCDHGDWDSDDYPAIDEEDDS